MIADGIYEEVVDDSFTIATALVAGAAPLYPPSSWYQDPSLSRPTPLTITEDGRIFGHIASWETNHIGLPQGTRPPHSRSGYAFFKTGVVRTAEGEDQPVGQLTLAGGHAPLSASASEAVEHYDNTNSAVADVTAGEDQHGIWISGGLRPGVTEEQIRALRASAPSGDWRPINGALELVAVCQVNTPGFPVARAMVASGEITALVAAGASRMYELQQEASVMDSLDGLLKRVSNLESVVAAGALARQGHADPAKDNLQVSDIGTGGLAYDDENINDGVSLDDVFDEVDITAGVPDDRVAEGGSAAEVVAKNGLNKATDTQKTDARLIGVGGSGVGDEAEAASGAAHQEAAACAACGHAEEVNGHKQVGEKRKPPKKLVAGGKPAFLLEKEDEDEDEDAEDAAEEAAESESEEKAEHASSKGKSAKEKLDEAKKARLLARFNKNKG